MRDPLAVRAHPLVFGVVLFLASESMFFAGLIASYYSLRAIASPWPPPGIHLDLVESLIGTILLGISSATTMAFQTLATRRRIGAARAMLVATTLLGLAFLGIAVHGWIHENFGIDSNAYGSLFYTMTGFHALHVTGGIVLLILMTVFLTRPAFTSARRAAVEAVAYYWHFVFVVWLALWATIYLIR
jgi:cytochrome c oxidase subunit III